MPPPRRFSEVFLLLFSTFGKKCRSLDSISVPRRAYIIIIFCNTSSRFFYVRAF